MATESFLSRGVVGSAHSQRHTAPQGYSENPPHDPYPKDHRHTAPQLRDNAMRSQSSDAFHSCSQYHRGTGGGGGVSHHHSNDYLYSSQGDQPKSFPQTNTPHETKFSSLDHKPSYDTKASVSTSVNARGQNIGTSVDHDDGYDTHSHTNDAYGTPSNSVYSTHASSGTSSSDGHAHSTHSASVPSSSDGTHSASVRASSDGTHSASVRESSDGTHSASVRASSDHDHNTRSAIGTSGQGSNFLSRDVPDQQPVSSTPSSVHQYDQRPLPHPSVPGGAVRVPTDPTHHRVTVLSGQTRSQSENTMSVPGCAYYNKPVRPSISQTTLSSSVGGAVSSSHPSGRTTLNASHATLENQRYSLDSDYTSDHPNEDRHFSLEKPKFKVFAVFDGHDGPRAAGFASIYMRQLFDTASWTTVVERGDPELIRVALGEFFRATEKEFFASIQGFVDEKERLQSRIPNHLSSYAAYQQYPNEVKRLQEVEPKLTGGCTAVLAVLVNDALYVANVGDSRAVLVTEGPDHTFSVEQLSVDHGVENEEELRRLERVGLDPKQLIKSGRLGMHENVRSIGDYSIKGGYKDVDTLRHAHSAPGIATPYIMPVRRIDHTFKHLLLMTDGVYKSVESTLDQQQGVDSNKVIVTIMERQLDLNINECFVADNVLGRISKIHSDCYERNAKEDPRSPMAVSCRKRDDMTLLVYTFPDSS